MIPVEEHVKSRQTAWHALRQSAANDSVVVSATQTNYHEYNLVYLPHILQNDKSLIHLKLNTFELNILAAQVLK